MALSLRSKFTRILNPKPKPYLLKPLSTTSDFADASPSGPHSIQPAENLKNFVDKLFTFNKDDDDYKVGEKVKDVVSVRKRMLAKMRDEWKVFRDGSGEENKRGILMEDVSSDVETEEKIEGNRVDECVAESIEGKGNDDEIWSDVELEENIEGKRGDECVTRCYGNDECVEESTEGGGNDEKGTMLGDLWRLEVEEGKDRNVDYDEDENRFWTWELGELEESSIAVDNRDNEGEKCRHFMNKKMISVNGCASCKLVDTLQMLKTVKKTLVRKDAAKKTVARIPMSMYDEENKGG